MRQRAPGRAIDYLKPLVENGTPDAATLTVLGTAYMAAEKPDLALQQFEKAVALEPGNPQIQTDIAVSEMGAGKGDKGLADLERVFESKSGSAAAGPTLVVTELRTGHLDKAAEVAASLVEQNPKSPLYQTPVGRGAGGAEELSRCRDRVSQRGAIGAGLRSRSAEPGPPVSGARPSATTPARFIRTSSPRSPTTCLALLGQADVAIAKRSCRRRSIS